MEKEKYRIIPAKNLRKISVRAKSTKRRIFLIHPSLDADGENNLAKHIGINTFVKGDLNWGFDMGANKYSTITSFDVLEHLQNPLLYLKDIYNHLDDKGILYLTTPVKWMFKGKHHFHEFTHSELVYCLHQAGFDNINVERIEAYNFSHFGIRPIIRKLRDILFGQNFFVTAIK